MDQEITDLESELTVLEGLESLVKELDEPDPALSALALRLAEIIDDTATPLSNIDRLIREYRLVLRALIDDYEPVDPDRGITPEQFEELFNGK